MKYLFFDTETTGVPKDYRAPYTDVDNYPRLVQLGWILSDEDGKELSTGDRIIKPNGFVIPDGVVKIHGITTDIAMQRGFPIDVVMSSFLIDLCKADRIVGHNISFDLSIIKAEFYRMRWRDVCNLVCSIPYTCTMLSSTNYCKIPGKGSGFKWPRLQELHKTLFGFEFDSAHNAMADIAATKNCYFELVKRGVIATQNY